MIQLLGDDNSTEDKVPSRKALARKLDEVIAHLNGNSQSLGSPIKMHHEELNPQPEPPRSTELFFHGFTPVGGKPDAAFFMPPAGFMEKNADGTETPIAGMIPRNALPKEALDHYTLLAQGANG